MPENSPFFPQVMRRYPIESPLAGVDRNFVAALLRAFEEKSFSTVEFDPFPVELIVEYIKRTHIFYLRTKLPEIEQSILLLSEQYTSHHPILAILHNFFQQYRHGLTTHIQAEESKLLPYIGILRCCIATPGRLSEFIAARRQCSVAGFLSGHHDTEDELSDIRTAIRLYDPPVTNASLYRVLLSQLETFEEDLHLHAHIEDEVLIPKALQMEVFLDGLVAGN